MKDLFDRNRAQLTRDEDARVWDAIRQANDGRTKSLWARLSVPVIGAAATAVALMVVIPRMGGLDEAADVGVEIQAPIAASRDVADRVPAPGETSTSIGHPTAEPPSLASSTSRNEQRNEGSAGGQFDAETSENDPPERIVPRSDLEETPGSIAGTVVDASTGEPLGFTNVFVPDTDLGGITNDDGSFEIREVPPGEVSVRSMYIGYEMEEQSVNVEPGQESSAAFQMEPKEAVAKFEARVLADRPVLTRRKSSALSTGGGETENESLPVDEITDAIALKAGVRADDDGELQFRGGKPGELNVMVDGMALTPPSTSASKRSIDGETPVTNQSWATLNRQHESARMRSPSTGGTDPVNDAAFDAMFFESPGVNPFVDTDDDRLATFAIDVDTASYNMMRAHLNRGALPPKEAIRVEEFVNAFDHSYGEAGYASLSPSITDTGLDGAFGIYLDAAPSKFGEGLSLLRVGLKGREVDVSERDPVSLTFVIDVSGSMGRDNRLGLVKKALHLLVDQLKPTDEIGIVTYGSTARVVSPMTPVRERWALKQIIDSLGTNGSTNAEDGLRQGYALAERAYRDDRNNRVILCSDGVANVGRTGPDAILEVIKEQAGRGIYMTAIGVGMGNHNDVLLERLANQADGNYFYVDTIADAKKVFVDNFTGTLQAIARDVKIQVEFDPAVVERYRLIGYENRDVADNDFRNDAVDGGEVGAGHEVTALFEVEAVDDASRNDVLAKVTLRYEDLTHGRMTEQESDIALGAVRTFDATDAEFRLDAAVAEFAELLRRSYWARDGQFADVAEVVDDVSDALPGRDDVRELSVLVRKAASLWPDTGGHYEQAPVPSRD